MMANAPTDGGGRHTDQFLRRSSASRSHAAQSLKWRLAWHRVRHLARQAINRRMTTEMADLAARIRKLHENEGEERRIGDRR